MREKRDAMLPYHCYGLDQFRHEYEALARFDVDGYWYKREEVDAEIERLRVEATELAVSERCAIDEIERLRARLAEAERDAARYRWLRDSDLVMWDVHMTYWRGAESLDEAIDAAMIQSRHPFTPTTLPPQEGRCHECGGLPGDAIHIANSADAPRNPATDR